jgi:hypothetical protein
MSKPSIHVVEQLRRKARARCRIHVAPGAFMLAIDMGGELRVFAMVESQIGDSGAGLGGHQVSPDLRHWVRCVPAPGVLQNPLLKQEYVYSPKNVSVFSNFSNRITFAPR